MAIGGLADHSPTLRQGQAQVGAVQKLREEFLRGRSARWAAIRAEAAAQAAVAGALDEVRKLAAEAQPGMTARDRLAAIVRLIDSLGRR